MRLEALTHQFKLKLNRMGKISNKHQNATDVYTLLGTVPLNGLIVVHERIAKVVKKWNNECWRLKFTDNNEIVNVFYPLSEDWHCA